MILTSIKLHPFAGTSNKDVVFAPGLNVIHGPNEAGKSTLVDAIRVVLFESVKNRKPYWETNLMRFVPLQGGDNFQVSLDFSIKSENYELTKKFGAEDSMKLVLPGGQTIVDPATAEGRLNELLEYKHGTWKNVLICQQDRLGETLESFSRGDYGTQELADRLRSAVMDTDGISFEGFDAAAAKHIVAYESNWDVVQDQPRDNRDVDNPWERKKGKILKSYYGLREREKELESVEQYERDHDRYNRTLAELTDLQTNLTAYIKDNARTFRSGQQQRTMKLELDAVIAEEKNLKTIYREWGKGELELETKVPQGPTLKQAWKTLEKELEECHTFQENKQQVEKLEKATQLDGELKEGMKHWDSITKIDASNLKEILALDHECQRVAAQLKAGKLAVRFAAKKRWSGTVIQGLNAREEKKLQAGKSLEFSADGYFVVENDDWTLTVQSGEVNFAELQAQHEKAKKKLTKVLTKYGASNLEEANCLAKEYADGAASVQDIKTRQEVILDGISIAELKKEIESIGISDTPRKMKTVQDELLDARQAFEKHNERITLLEGNVKGWTEEFASQDKLADRLLELKEGVNQKQKAFEAATDDLLEIDDTSSFLEEYEKKKASLEEDVNPKIHETKGQITGLGTAPELSVQDLKVDIEVAEANFDRVKEEHAAYLRIQNTIKTIRDRQSSDPLQPWVDNLETMLGNLSEGRYRKIHVEQGAAERNDGTEINYLQLSSGTKTILGFALRLSMAEHFLAETDGFIILDDPLVDMDPARQAATVKLIQQYATSKQIILLTCHPSHAAMFELEPIQFEQIV